MAARPVPDHRGDRCVSAAPDSVNVAALTRLLIAVGQQRHSLERKGMKPNVSKLHSGTSCDVQFGSRRYGIEPPEIVLLPQNDIDPAATGQTPSDHETPPHAFGEVARSSRSHGGSRPTAPSRQGRHGKRQAECSRRLRREVATQGGGQEAPVGATAPRIAAPSR